MKDIVVKSMPRIGVFMDTEGVNFEDAETELQRQLATDDNLADGDCFWVMKGQTVTHAYGRDKKKWVNLYGKKPKGFTEKKQKELLDFIYADAYRILSQSGAAREKS